MSNNIDLEKLWNIKEARNDGKLWKNIAKELGYSTPEGPLNFAQRNRVKYILNPNTQKKINRYFSLKEKLFSSKK